MAAKFQPRLVAAHARGFSTGQDDGAKIHFPTRTIPLKQGDGKHSFLVAQVQRLLDVRAQWPEHRPHDEAEIKI